jgi:Protein of unknown function (DUF3618)
MDQEASTIRLEVEEAREHLGETVEALAYKVNAPKRIKDKASEKAAGMRRRLNATRAGRARTLTKKQWLGYIAAAAAAVWLTKKLAA